jgi:hypothetical protein
MNEQTEHTQKIVDLERELKFRDRRINELKSEIDGLRQVVRDTEEWVKERDAYLEEFITTFGLDLDNDGFYRNGDFYVVAGSIRIFLQDPKESANTISFP